MTRNELIRKLSEVEKTSLEEAENHYYSIKELFLYPNGKRIKDVEDIKPNPTKGYVYIKLYGDEGWLEW